MPLTEAQKNGIENELERGGYTPLSPFTPLIRNRLEEFVELGKHHGIFYDGGPWDLYARQLKETLGEEP